MRITYIFAFLLLSTIVLAQEEPQLAVIPVELNSNFSFPLSNTITFSYLVNKPEKVFQHLAQNKNLKLEIANDVIKLELDQSTTLGGTPLENHSKSSFVIDLEEDSTQKFLLGFNLGELDKKTIIHSSLMHQLKLYSHDFIEEPTYINGFLIASKVAAIKSGDCTEYAMLTTALARHLNYPARYITGLVIVGAEQNEQNVGAYGHAWTEVWYDDSWHIVDAAMFDANTDDVKLYYLPISALNNEGPGYIFSAMEAVFNLPSKITNLNNI